MELSGIKQLFLKAIQHLLLTSFRPNRLLVDVASVSVRFSPCYVETPSCMYLYIEEISSSPCIHKYVVDISRDYNDYYYPNMLESQACACRSMCPYNIPALQHPFF